MHHQRSGDEIRLIWKVQSPLKTQAPYRLRVDYAQRTETVLRGVSAIGGPFGAGRIGSLGGTPCVRDFREQSSCQSKQHNHLPEVTASHDGPLTVHSFGKAATAHAAGQKALAGPRAQAQDPDPRWPPAAT